MRDYKYILVNGYTSTGSSAAIDLLKEYRNVAAPDKEFRIIKDPHGIYDLDKSLNQSTDLLNEDIAAREFLWLVHKYGMIAGKFRPTCLSYNKDFGNSFEELSKNYIQELMSSEYKGYWWYLNLDKTTLECVCQKILKKLNIFDYRKVSKMRLFLKNEDEFLRITQKYINQIFNSMDFDDSIDTIVLDQAIPATHSGLAQRYFHHYRVINIERDPRAVYIDLITEEKRNGDIVGHVGFDIATTHNVDLFIQWFKKCRNKGPQGDELNINFEDIILNYEATVKKIEEFIAIDCANHIQPLKYLKPEVSRKNVRYWDGYEHQNEIKQIEKALPEYLYPGL